LRPPSIPYPDSKVQREALDCPVLASLLSRDKEEQGIREKMAKEAIGGAGFQEQMEKKAIEIKRPRRGRPTN